MKDDLAVTLERKSFASMEVKIFSGNDLSSTETELNYWLKKNQVSVHHIGQSQCERNGNLLVAISVFYISANKEN